MCLICALLLLFSYFFLFLQCCYKIACLLYKSTLALHTLEIRVATCYFRAFSR